MNQRRFPSSLFPLPIIFVLQVMLGIPQSLGNPEFFKACRDAQFICGNISAEFPFPGPSIPSDCGHPVLKLDSKNHTPIIEINNVRYQVLDIHPDRQTLRIARLDIYNIGLCNLEFQNSALDYKLFDFVNASDYANVTLVYGCPNLAQTLPGHSNCKVHRAGYEDVWVVPEVIGSVPCSARVTVPIVRSSLAGICNYSLLLEGLKEGFEVKWKQDSQVCQKCKGTGGVCGFGFAYKTICFCTNPHILEEQTECPPLNPHPSPPPKPTPPSHPHPMKPNSEVHFRIRKLSSIHNSRVPTTTCADDLRYSECRTTIRCGSISNIDYPFWGMNRANNCGQPGFELKCEDDIAKITMSQNTLRILDVNPQQQSLKVAREDYWNDYCPMELINTTINFNHFDYGSSLRNLTLFYANTSLLGDPRPGACRGSVIVPVYETAAQTLEVTPLTINNSLKGGFELQWKVDNDQCRKCRKCRDSDGVSGYNQTTNSFICFYRDQPSETTCLPTQGALALLL
ncbi:hypothetical protein CRYUN_Cryun01aG0094200 [Craigia yunnanensis]